MHGLQGEDTMGLGLGIFRNLTSLICSWSLGRYLLLFFQEALKGACCAACTQTFKKPLSGGHLLQEKRALRIVGRNGKI